MARKYSILIANLIFISCYAQSQVAGGDHYLLPGFTQGVILFKTGKTDTKLLNYNILAEQLLFDNQSKILAVPKEQLDRIDTAFINGRRFIILDNAFVEVLHQAAWDLYVEYKCELIEQGKNAGYGGTSQTSAINTPSAVELGGNVYNLQLPDGYKIKRYSLYWLKKNTETEQFVNMRQLKKLYKDKNELFNDYIKKHDIKFEDQESIIQLVEYLESH